MLCLYRSHCYNSSKSPIYLGDMPLLRVATLGVYDLMTLGKVGERTDLAKRVQTP